VRSSEPMAGAVKLMFRPEQIQVRRPQPSDAGTANSFAGKVEATLFLGNCTEYAVQVGGHRIVARSLLPAGVDVDDAVTVSIAAEHIRLFAAEAETSR
jgi:ABC-type Fe3+/spermidine/putrescine transport system ATPase subunit